MAIQRNKPDFGSNKGIVGISKPTIGSVGVGEQRPNFDSLFGAFTGRAHQKSPA